MSKSANTKVLIGLRALLGLVFAAAGLMKLLGQPMMVAEFDTVGLGQWFRYFTGTVEIAGAILLVSPKTVAFGAALLLCVSIGAAFAQLLRLHGDVIHTLVFSALLAWIAYNYFVRPRVEVAPPATPRNHKD